MARFYKELVKLDPSARHDPFVRQELRREERREEMNAMCPMCQMPRQSGWIWLLQNRVNLKSVGNLRLARKVWFHAQTRSVGPGPSYDKDSFEPFQEARLSNGERANGWTVREVR